MTAAPRTPAPMARNFPALAFSTPWNTAIVQLYTATSWPMTTALPTLDHARPCASKSWPRLFKAPSTKTELEESNAENSARSSAKLLGSLLAKKYRKGRETRARPATKAEGVSGDDAPSPPVKHRLTRTMARTKHACAATRRFAALRLRRTSACTRSRVSSISRGNFDDRSSMKSLKPLRPRGRARGTTSEAKRRDREGRARRDGTGARRTVRSGTTSRAACSARRAREGNPAPRNASDESVGREADASMRADRARLSAASSPEGAPEGRIHRGCAGEEDDDDPDARDPFERAARRPRREEARRATRRPREAGGAPRPPRRRRPSPRTRRVRRRRSDQCAQRPCDRAECLFGGSSDQWLSSIV